MMPILAINTDVHEQRSFIALLMAAGYGGRFALAQVTILDSSFFQISHWLPSGSISSLLLFRKRQGEFL